MIRSEPKYAFRNPALLAVASVCLVLPRTGAAESVADREEQIVLRIVEEQAKNGAHSENLIEPLTDLGQLYQERGRNTLATAALEQARQVVRANYGLNALEEAPLIQEIIRNEEAVGRIESAWELERKLLQLAKRYPKDPRTVPILHEAADKRMDVLRRYESGEFPEEIVLGCYYRRSPFAVTNCRSGERSVVIRSLLAEAWRYYGDAIRVLLRNEDYSSAELRGLEMQLVESSYRYGALGIGEKSLQRLLAYDVANGEPLMTRTRSLLRVADWNVLQANAEHRFFEHESTLETYQQLHDMLVRDGVSQEAIDEFFSPRLPIVLPTFLPNPLAPDERAESDGYVDVSFIVTTRGYADGVRAVSRSKNLSRADERNVERFVERLTFRPRMTGGKIADSEPFVVRYYVNE